MASGEAISWCRRGFDSMMARAAGLDSSTWASLPGSAMACNIAKYQSMLVISCFQRVMLGPAECRPCCMHASVNSRCRLHLLCKGRRGQLPPPLLHEGVQRSRIHSASATIHHAGHHGADIAAHGAWHATRASRHCNHRCCEDLRNKVSRMCPCSGIDVYC